MRSFLFSILIVCSFQNSLHAQTDGRLLVHLLSYMAADYGMAVQDGEIISEAEYAEMLEFASSIKELSVDLEDSSQAQASQLENLVISKVSQNEIKALVSKIKSAAIEVHQLQTAPIQWPRLENAKKIFAAQCQSCHGADGKGDGPLAAGLDPLPTNFHEPDKADGLSPFQAFNTIKLGVEGTSMMAFSDLTEEETWDLAFYILTLSQQSVSLTEDLKLSKSIGLAQLASKSNEELQKVYPRLKEDKALMAVARMNPEGLASANEPNHLEYARITLRKAEASYLKGNKEEARNFALKAYLDGVEPIEVQLAAKDKHFSVALEQQLAEMRSYIEAGKPTELVSSAVEQSIAMLNEGETILKDKGLSTWLSFIISFTIILREGLEAVLVIIAILSVLKATGVTKAQAWVHGGWVLALISGLALWWGAQTWFVFGGAEREVMEGLIALMAVVVLLYLGFWMHSKTEASKWQKFVNEKIGRLTQKNSMMGLAGLSFLVVFREAFESVLFLSAVSLEGAKGTNAAIGAGVVSAFVVIGVLAVLLLKFSKRLPLAQLFKYSSLLVAVLAVVLVGKGVAALQEAGWLNISLMPFETRIDLLGFYPTWQSIGAQIFIFLVAVVLWRWSSRPLQVKPQV